MTYLLIASLALLVVAGWIKLVSNTRKHLADNEMIAGARDRAAERNYARAFADTESTEWESAVQIHTALETAKLDFESGVTVNDVTPEELLTISLILDDVEQLPEIVTTDGLEIIEIDLDKDVWANKKA